MMVPANTDATRAVPTPPLGEGVLGSLFTGPLSERIKQARAAADHLGALLAAIDAGELEAAPTEIARLEGAELALRLVSRTKREATLDRRAVQPG